jgi:carbamoyl-phosphate synthase large subunit
MATRVLVLGAGSGAGNNLIRSLRAADAAIVTVGAHHDPFVLKKSIADRHYLIARPAQPHFLASLQRVIARERVDVLIPHGDGEVRVASELRAELSCRLFLPSPAAIALCQDKYALTARLASLGVPVPTTYPIGHLDEVDAVFGRFPPGSRLWCRIRAGAGSLGATPVDRPEHARSWITYWQDLRGVPASSFTLSEYLPGRDFACQSLWRDGELCLIKTVERLTYFGGASQPSGVSSIAGLAKTVCEPRVVEVCTGAIRGLGAGISGAFSVDLKANRAGVPCVTEINAGRFITMTNLFDLAGKHNMTAAWVRLALGEPVDLHGEYDVAEDHYFMRDVDTTPGIVHGDELFEGIEDARE